MIYISYINLLDIQIRDLLKQLAPMQYVSPLEILHGATIGQHVRHIIEFFEELENGYKSGTVSYDKRKRDLVLENEPTIAIETLQKFISTINKKDRELVLQLCYSIDDEQHVELKTTYYRELAYAIDHTVHHMAMIRTALSMFPSIEVPSHFGLASSTRRYQDSCAQ